MPTTRAPTAAKSLPDAVLAGVGRRRQPRDESSARAATAAGIAAALSRGAGRVSARALAQARIALRGTSAGAPSAAGYAQAPTRPAISARRRSLPTTSPPEALPASFARTPTRI